MFQRGWEGYFSQICNYLKIMGIKKTFFSFVSLFGYYTHVLLLENTYLKKIHKGPFNFLKKSSYLEITLNGVQKISTS